MRVAANSYEFLVLPTKVARKEYADMHVQPMTLECARAARHRGWDGVLAVLCLFLSVFLFISRSAAAAGIPLAALSAKAYRGGLVPNSEFWPGPSARAAREPFRGVLRLAEAKMQTIPSSLKPRYVLGKDTMAFPGIDLTFFTVGSDLVPITQDVIRSGTTSRSRSFWDVIVQPGKIWSEPGDGAWSRAAFPFALVNSIEGESHNGIATFAYRGTQVSDVRFQIVQQTAPFLVTNDFTASGILIATFRQAAIPNIASQVRRYEAARAHEVRFRPWTDLVEKAGAKALENFDESVPERSRVLAGIYYHDAFYLQFCASAAGPLPWCDRARFGVWSATKALVNETALLRLAQKFGPSVFDMRMARFIPALSKIPAWRDVRFEDAINMATGLGNGSTNIKPNNISDGYLDPTYDVWYTARSEADKIAAIVRSERVYPWGPGKVARYRDQDMFLLGVAMDRFLKSREGSKANIWSMLEAEVFRPIGIYYAPTNRTIEPGGRPGQPLMAYGYYPTVGDMVKIAELYQSDGRFGKSQILYSPRIRAILDGRHRLGLPTGVYTQFGQTTYYNAFWMNAYHDGCELRYPVMEGWGGNLVALFPNGMTAIRIDKADEHDEASSDDPSSMALVADRIRPFCH